ncbi:alkanesulfonate monooxygenase [Burkholderia sp. D7]|nr:alkanesulfonate monooxygenase [Burkholderia sp. D7]
MAERKKLKLGLSLAANGTHKAGWRLPAAAVGAAVDPALWKEVARRAEQAKIHFIFLADGAAVRTEASSDEELSYNGRIDQFEPLTLLSALSSVTERIGLIATASTTYNEPYTVARKYASLDILSGGRAGWNVVTSWSEAEAHNFNRDQHLEHSFRYRRAEEFVDVVLGLWDSWEDDAFVRNKESGIYFDPKKMHTLNHRGEFFSVAGPLNIVRAPQGYPVIAQAGSSEPGQELAARTADLVYTAQQTLQDAKKFYGSLKGRLSKYGRSPDSVVIMPGVLAIVGKTESEAKEKYDELQSLIHPKIGMAMLTHIFGDLSQFPLDGPLPPLPADPNNVSRSIRQAWIERAARDNMTIRQLYQAIAVAAGHRLVIGTAASVADQLEEWFVNDACDGFNFMAPSMPNGVYDILDTVIPELQRRGLFHTEYEGQNLRESLGLPRPANVHAA